MLISVIMTDARKKCPISRVDRKFDKQGSDIRSFNGLRGFRELKI